jgi:hypothetical protein
MKIKIQLSEKYVPVFILLLCILSYSLTLFLGYFGDDWFVMWNFHAMGARGVFESYAMDRPIHGYLLGYLMQILGETPITWHIAALLVRYAGAMTSWLLLRQIWPDYAFENTSAAVFIAIYPGFTQQALSLVYILQVFGAMALWALSAWLMLFTYRNKRYQPILIPLASIFSFAHLAMSEYFIGLEFVRPLLLGLVFAQISTINLKLSWRIWVKEIFLNWLPYLATLIIYLVYRLVFFHSGRPETDSATIVQRILASPLAELSHRVASILTDPVKVIILAWIQPLNKFIATYMISPRIWWDCMGIFAIVTLLSWAFFLSLKKLKLSAEPTPLKWESQALWLGLSAVVIAGLPLWGINREVTISPLGDRYAFPFIFGSALVLASGIFLIAKKPKTRYIIAAFIVGVNVGFHIWNTYLFYQTDWVNQQDFHSQLSWRVPGLQKGTSIWVVKDPSVLAMEGDDGLAMPVNWIYGAEPHGSEVNYWVFPLTEEFLGRTKIFQMGSESQIQRPLRNISFTGNPNQTIVVWFSPQNCLKVIDPNQPELLESYTIPSIARSLAHTGPIITSPGQTPFPVNVFGIQEKGWCYYFEQADWARQSKDWQTAAELGDEAIEKGLKPFNSLEWMPFIESYIQVERYNDALQLINRVKDSEYFSSKLMVCGFVNRMNSVKNSENNSVQTKFLTDIAQQYNCPIP